MFISCALLFFLPGARSLLSGLHAHRVQLPPPAVSAARPSLELRSASNSGARPSSLNMHQGYPKETLVRFLKAREWNVAKAHKMIVECLNWRIQNEIDSVLERPIAPVDLYKSIRDSQLIGLSRYTKEILLYNFDGGTICSVVILKEWLGIHRVAAAEISKGLPIFGIGVGHSTYDKASVITLMLAICLVGYSYSQNHKSAWFEAISTKPNKGTCYDS
ncbi:Sec14p-like phosphatidylinositol transfer family protein [Zea mays]|uniref:Sec14p-like phosphatidylinositol transfer family protein n=1 Tax=Zea mays TaxID=4577 RepID=A0A1D6IX66_MAIZE|nr:Sec14p-like phosphatidylinositol transfer family protein [Zea mays]